MNGRFDLSVVVLSLMRSLNRALLFVFEDSSPVQRC